MAREGSCWSMLVRGRRLLRLRLRLVKCHSLCSVEVVVVPCQGSPSSRGKAEDPNSGVAVAGTGMVEDLKVVHSLPLKMTDVAEIRQEVHNQTGLAVDRKAAHTHPSMIHRLVAVQKDLDIFQSA